LRRFHLAIDLGNFEWGWVRGDLEERIASLHGVTYFNQRSVHDSGDLRLHLELLPRLNLTDSDRFLHDRSRGDVDELRPATALLAVARNRVNGSAGASDYDQEQQCFPELPHWILSPDHVSTKDWTIGLFVALVTEIQKTNRLVGIVRGPKGLMVVTFTSPRPGEFAIITVDQLPDSRRAILVALKRRGASTIAHLADELQLTGEAVRQQLLQLQREGWIEARVTRSSERGRTGRPATSYSLTEAGDHLFPKRYDALNVEMMDAIAQELGPEALKRILEHLANEKVEVIEPGLRPLSLSARMQALKDWYLKDDPYMAIEQAEGGFKLVERNCPFINTAMNRPSLCSISVNALMKVLGVRVVREEKFQNGDSRCVFRVYANEPVDADTLEFRLESEM